MSTSAQIDNLTRFQQWDMEMSYLISDGVRVQKANFDEDQASGHLDRTPQSEIVDHLTGFRGGEIVTGLRLAFDSCFWPLIWTTAWTAGDERG